jgi:hypothetical protein
MRRLGDAATTFLVGASLAALLSACSGSVTTRPAAAGANGDAGPMAVRNAVLVLGPEGSASATIVATLVNSASTVDELISVEVESVTAPAVFITGGSIAVPVGRPVSLGHSGKLYVNLSGFHPLPSEVTPVKFAFRDSGQLTMKVLVVPATDIYAGISPSPIALPTP